MIETNGLTKRYGRFTALDGLDLKIPSGELFGFIGPNGAGKTTTIQILATLLAPTEGSATIDGLDVRREGPRVRKLIGYMPDFLVLYENLQVIEYLEFFSAAYDVAPHRRTGIMKDVLEITGLAGKRHSMVGELSRGMQQRLSLARVLVHDPKVLLLDEPASGLDPRARVELREILRELQSMGKTILISSHILSELAEICSSIGILSRGKLVAFGPVAAVLATAGAGRGVRVEIEGGVDGAGESLRLLPGIDRVDSTGPDALFVRFAPGHDLVAEVAAHLVATGHRLRRLDPERLDLEEAYLRLTAPDEA